MSRRKRNTEKDNKISPIEMGNFLPRKFFISYAHGEKDDELLAETLFAVLAGAGHGVFIDKTIPLGTKWAEEISNRIEWCDYLIVLLSATSIHSEMVLEEIRLARQRRITNKRSGGIDTPQFFPVRVRYTGPLGYALGAYLNQYEWRTWHGNSDTNGILEEILDVAQGHTLSNITLIPPLQNHLNSPLLPKWT